jgi:hypothetical protein
MNHISARCLARKFRHANLMKDSMHQAMAIIDQQWRAAIRCMVRFDM